MNGEIAIVFLRHGRSRADDEGVHEGRYDSPLTDVGRAQVAARAAEWRAAGVRFDRIVCSPLRRAEETANIVGAALDVPLEEDAGWLEVDNGPLAGLSFAEADARYPRPAFRSPFERLAGVGESAWSLQCRAAAALERVVRRGPGRYLVVAHGGVLNAALRSVVGAQPPANDQGVWFHLGDAGYVATSYDPARHRWIVRELRD